MPYSTLSVSHDGPVSVLTLRRPEKLNAINPEMIRELTQCFEELVQRFASSRLPRAALITAEGEKAFVAGADLASMSQMSASEAQAFSAEGHRLAQHMECAPFPIVAAVNGFALGGGLELALAADFIHASESARFGMPEVTVGLIPGFGGTLRLAARVGIGLAREMIFSGRQLSAGEALARGLVTQVRPSAELLQGALETCGKIALAAPLAVANAKKLLSRDPNGGGHYAVEARLFGELFDTADGREGMTAFIEKRKPRFEGS